MKQIQAVRFMHIPKTAGTSVTECLIRMYGGRKVNFPLVGIIETDIKRYEALTAKEKNKILLATGHAPRWTDIPAIDSLSIITFLREPVARVQSFCQHVKEGKSPYLLNSFPPASFNLDEFIASGNYELSNLQVKMLSGFSGEINRENYAPHLAYAIQELRDSIVFFGLVERYDESLMLMKLTFNWPWPTYRTLNQADKSCLIPFTDEQVEKIRELNFADLMLYEAAVKIFNSRVEKNRDEIATSLKIFVQRQKLYGMYFKAAISVRFIIHRLVKPGHAT